MLMLLLLESGERQQFDRCGRGRIVGVDRMQRCCCIATENLQCCRATVLVLVHRCGHRARRRRERRTRIAIDWKVIIRIGWFTFNQLFDQCILKRRERETLVETPSEHYLSYHLTWPVEEHCKPRFAQPLASRWL